MREREGERDGDLHDKVESVMVIRSGWAIRPYAPLGNFWDLERGQDGLGRKALPILMVVDNPVLSCPV